MRASTPVPRQAYQIASWVTAGLAFVAAVLAFAFGLAALTGPTPADDGQRLTTGPGPRTTAAAGDVLSADQSVVSGTITRVVGIKVVAPSLPLPLTLTVVRGGGTKAEIAGGAVAGKNATITWDGGRPLPLRGRGSIDLNGPVNVEVTAAGASWAMDGGARLLTPGTYNLGATVAIIPLKGGLGTPKDGARLDVPPGAAASLSTNGDVRTTTPRGAVSLRGPGQLVLEGTFEVRTRDGIRQARRVTFGPGAFELDLQPAASGYQVDGALLQGPMVVEP